MKTLSLKISLSILVGILAVICMTAGVVLAGFSSANLTPSVPVSKISSQVWTDENMTTEVTSNGRLTGGTSAPLYISATKNKTAIDIPCVMRVSTTFASVTPTDSWIKQSNGWYYYVGIVGGGCAGDYSTSSQTAVQFCTKYTAGSNPHITVELMQYSTIDSGGFIKEWSPSAGSSQKLLNESTTVDGRSLTPKSGYKFTGSFALFKTETSGAWYALPAVNATTGTTSSLSGMTVNSDGSLSFANTTYVGTTSWTELQIYNNAPFPMVYSFSITTTVGTIATIDNNDNNWKEVGTTTNSDGGVLSYQYVYAKSVLPGQYLSIANKFQLSVTSGTANISISVNAVDVDTFVNSFGSTSYATALGDNLTSLAPFTNWVNKMVTYFNSTVESASGKTVKSALGEFPTPKYQKKSDTGEA